MRKDTTLSYIQQDHLTGTSVISDTSGNSTGTIKYMPFGVRRNSTGTIPTDKQFTGQRLDDTGLYYYGARYYDPTIGRFISPDPIILNIRNPQLLNRYSYCLNNPLRYIDTTGLWGEELGAPPMDGILGYTEEEGWLYADEGQWNLITDNAVDLMIADYVESTETNWLDYAEKHGPDIIAGQRSILQGGNITPDGKREWVTKTSFDRKGALLNINSILLNIVNSLLKIK
jgi:RHS repeat-associated protein